MIHCCCVNYLTNCFYSKNRFHHCAKRYYLKNCYCGCYLTHSFGLMSYGLDFLIHYFCLTNCYDWHYLIHCSCLMSCYYANLKPKLSYCVSYLTNWSVMNLPNL